MKKLFAAFIITLFMLVACQDGSSIVAPTSDSGTTVEKKVDSKADSSDRYDSGRPILPRI